MENMNKRQIPNMSWFWILFPVSVPSFCVKSILTLPCITHITLPPLCTSPPLWLSAPLWLVSPGPCSPSLPCVHKSVFYPLSLSAPCISECIRYSFVLECCPFLFSTVPVSLDYIFHMHPAEIVCLAFAFMVVPSSCHLTTELCI